jgi:hypothetical protein
MSYSVQILDEEDGWDDVDVGRPLLHVDSAVRVAREHVGNLLTSEDFIHVRVVADDKPDDSLWEIEVRQGGPLGAA